MTNKRLKLVGLLLVLNSAFWLLFWATLFWISESSPSPLAVDLLSIYHTHPMYISVFGRGLPEGVPYPMQVALWSQLPSLLLAGLLGHFVPGDLVLAETNQFGLRLIAATIFSYAQWYLIGSFFVALKRKFRLRIGNP